MFLSVSKELEPKPLVMEYGLNLAASAAIRADSVWALAAVCAAFLVALPPITAPTMSPIINSLCTSDA